MAKKPATAIEQLAATVQPGATPELPDESTQPTSSAEPASQPAQQSLTPQVDSDEHPVVDPQPSQGGGKPDFLETVRSLGFQDVSDEDVARQRLIEAYQQRSADLEAREQRLRELEPFARYGQEYVETLRSGGAPQSSRQQPEQKPTSWWNPPQVDMALVRKYQVTDPATGEARWSQDTPAHVRADFEKYDAHIAKWGNDLMYRPADALKAPVQEVVEQYLQQVFGIPLSELPQRLDLSGEQRAYNELVAQHGERIYVRDPITNRIDQTRLTPFGETVEQMLEKAASMGISKPQDRLEYAMQIAEIKHPQQKTVEKRQEIRKDVLRRAGATGLPQRNGSTTVEGRPQNRNLTPGQQLVQKLEGLAT